MQNPKDDKAPANKEVGPDRDQQAQPEDLAAPQQVFLGNHLKDWPDVLRHASVNKHERLLQARASLRRHAVVAEQRVPRQKAAPAHTMFRVSCPS